MCGIAAWINWGGRSRTFEVEDTLKVVRHRGPDGGGDVSTRGLTLDQRRPSIIDLIINAAQPTAQGDLTVVFNGEMCNYQELRQNLRLLGYSFESDGEADSGPSIRTTQSQELHGPQLARLQRYADLASMATSVEDRLPSLDHNLIALAMSMPVSLLFRDGWTKWPLRSLASTAIPHHVAWRKQKVGFEAPRYAVDPRDRSSLDLIRPSGVVHEMRVDLTSLDGLPNPMAWRLFAVALWDREVLG